MTILRNRIDELLEKQRIKERAQRRRLPCDAAGLNISEKRVKVPVRAGFDWESIETTVYYV